MNEKDLWQHFGHKLELATYGDKKDNISLECVDCFEIIWDNEKGRN